MRMDLVSRTGDLVRLDLSESELTISNNALNEVANGLDLAEFSTRMGAERDDVQWLLQEVREILDRLANTGAEQ